jgi:hypothetical protein
VRSAATAMAARWLARVSDLVSNGGGRGFGGGGVGGRRWWRWKGRERIESNAVRVRVGYIQAGVGRLRPAGEGRKCKLLKEKNP